MLGEKNKCLQIQHIGLEVEIIYAFVNKFLSGKELEKVMDFHGYSSGREHAALEYTGFDEMRN